MTQETFLQSETTTFDPSDIDTVIQNYLLPADVVKSGKKVEYFNIPCAFDIETTSFYNEGEKQACMYEWTLGLNGAVMIGRTWEELREVYQTITERLALHSKRRLVIYIHNAGFEFQFMRKRFEWEKVFAISERKPIYALTAEGVEFRCSYLLSGYPLATLGEQLHKYKVAKMVGDLDYSLPRHSETPLTDKELKYCINDARVVMAYIQERIEKDGDISRIPMTKTGYVRNYCRNCCMYEGSHKKNALKFLRYRRIMNALRVSPDEYRQLKRAFQGGFTHANAYYSGKTLKNVGSYDFTSSYPAVMVSEQFPMSNAEEIKIKSQTEFDRNLMLYCCLFDVKIEGLEAITMFEHPLSHSRCWGITRSTEDNGRIVEADRLYTTLTEQDYYILKKFYHWKKFEIRTFRRYKKGYLPTDFVKAVLKLYEDKTTLKNVVGKEEDYLRSKEMVNACYGMMVTDIWREEITYKGDEWRKSVPDIETAIDKYNESVRRFLFYPWGVWVTAYARRNLFTGIYEFGTDYVYSDTDSVKALNIAKHQRYIEEYNRRITAKLERACKYHMIDPARTRPKTIEGVEKQLGVWDFEGVYTRFKTLGAKRYMTEKPDKKGVLQVSITVSGVNKFAAVPYLKDKYKDQIFDAFDDELYIPPENTGKNTHTYIDYEQRGILKDYTGAYGEYHEYSSTHLEAADYSLSLSRAYVDYIKGVREYSK
jgi:hypothetical protein